MPIRFGDLTCARYVPRFCTPVSGSLVMKPMAVRYGALSHPGVEIGTGRLSRPRSGSLSEAPLTTTSWQTPVATIRGVVGAHRARVQAAWESAVLSLVPIS